MTSASGGVSMCRMPGAGGHPLRGAVVDDAAAAVAVLVLEGAVDHVGDGLEAAVRVPRGALGLARRVVDLAHLVHVDERVEIAHRHAGEGAHDGEALALVAARAGGDLLDRALGVAERGRGDARQGQGVSGDGRHVVLLLLRLQLYDTSTRVGTRPFPWHH